MFTFTLERFSHVGFVLVCWIELIVSTEEAFWEVTTRIHNMFTSSMNRLASVSSMTALFIHSTCPSKDNVYLDGWTAAVSRWIHIEVVTV